MRKPPKPPSSTPNPELPAAQFALCVPRLYNELECLQTLAMN